MLASEVTSARHADFEIDYGREIEAEIEELVEAIGRYPAICQHFPPRWLAIKLLERDEDIQIKLLHVDGGPPLLTKAQISLSRLQTIHGEDVDAVIAGRRYTWIHHLVAQAVDRPAASQLTRSDKIDRIVTHRILGVPIFLAAMWVVFRLTADISAPLLDWIDTVLNGPITRWVVGILQTVGLGSTWVESLFVDGIIAGVGGVLVFIPVLMSLYLALAILEDSGYMARAAFVMDRLMGALGMHGKSFLPLLVGFGCNVPAIYATRTLENEKDRILTGLLVPFMSCGARLPVYILFAAIFFPSYAGLVVFSLYLIGIVTAVFLGFILKKTLFKGEEQGGLIMELPPYRLPTLKSIWFHMWKRTVSFVHHAWTIILGASIVIWLLMAIPVQAEGNTFAETNIDHSAFAAVSGALTPLFEPLGFGNWQASGSLMSGFVAKEVVVSTLAQTYGIEEMEETAGSPTFLEDLRTIFTSFTTAAIDTVKSLPLVVGIDLSPADAEEPPTGLMVALRHSFETSSRGHGALAAFAFMVFVLLYTPCMVTIAAEKQELGTKWMWFSITGQLILAWLMAFLVFQGGRLLGIG